MAFEAHIRTYQIYLMLMEMLEAEANSDTELDELPNY